MKLKFPNFVLATLALFTLDGCYQAPAESQAPTDAAIQTLSNRGAKRTRTSYLTASFVIIIAFLG
jgi:hypothetical protein